MTKLPILLLLGAATFTPAAINAGRPAHNKGEVILHAWSWSLDTIAANMKRIADAGYDYVQTSPVQRCFVGENGGMALYSQPGDSVKGKWYYYYQPTDWQIGNYMLGDRDDFKAMCDSAYKYGVKVIVDVLPNHTAVEHTAVLPGLDNAVGGHDNLYHANGMKDCIDYNNRLECTNYYMQYVNDLINLGARGFRYDTAKHIGLPSDPLDPKAKENDFWDVATGRKAAKGLSLLMPDSLYIYGEVLQDKNVKETEYDDYMDLTASSYGHALRNVLASGDARVEDLANWHHPSDPTALVTWVESHDTYCNQNESAGLTDDQIRTGWVFLTSRATGKPLFFSRPAGSTRQNYWGNNRIGARGNDEFFHPEVVAANKFRHDMSGQPESLSYSDNGAVAMVSRGTKGLALVNFSTKGQKVKMATALPDGTYTDPVSTKTFKVSKGILTGRLDATTTYILRNE